ncbi:3-5 exonuclease domain-containing protein [Cystoisospora suis]|uniref:3-5 exonuclease domain-containing protein n=1 Tax=Cystoisospora suis TaxID=483139 RepID=A0A2C6L324_9APIC|nr:3-5 exonuclease domain-containing protein [Cystoisospora suis]
MRLLLKRFYRCEGIEKQSFFLKDLSMDQRRFFRTWMKRKKKFQEIEKVDEAPVHSLESHETSSNPPLEASWKGKKDRESSQESTKVRNGEERGIFSICPLQLKRLPQAKFTGRLIVVRNVEDDRAACEALLQSARSETSRKSSASSFSSPKREDEELLLGYDSEHEPTGSFLDSPSLSSLASLSLFSSSSPRPPLSLIQLSSGTSLACIWQLRHLGGLPRHLVSLLVREDIRKITQGASSEVRALQTEFGIAPRNFMCLHAAAISLGCVNHSRSLQALSGIFLGKYVDKALQLSHWSKKELSQEELIYAATDAYVSRQVLLGMRKKHSPLGGREDTYMKLIERQARVDGLLHEKDDKNEGKDPEGEGSMSTMSAKVERKISMPLDHRPPNCGDPTRPPRRDDVLRKIENFSGCLQVDKIPHKAGIMEETSEKERPSTVHSVDRVEERRALSEGVTAFLSDGDNKTEEVEGNFLEERDTHAGGEVMIKPSRLCREWREGRTTHDPLAQGIATLSLPETQANVSPSASTACRSSEGDTESIQMSVDQRGMGGEQERCFSVGTSRPERRKSSLSVEYCSQLKALCLEKGWKLNCDRLESSRTGFKSVFSVNCGRSGQWTAKSKIAHTTLRAAQNDAAEQLLSSLKARHS